MSFPRDSSGSSFFFAISGFVLALPFAEHHLFAANRPSLRAYFTRRLTRIEPPYLLNILAILAMLAVFKRESLRALLPEGLSSVVYLHGFIYPNSNGVNPAFWSLEVEVQFYALAPLQRWAVQMAALTTVILLVSSLLFVLVERPCMRRDWPARLWQFLRLQSAGSDVGEQSRSTSGNPSTTLTDSYRNEDENCRAASAT